MSASKRKWEELDDDEEDSPAYGKQILPVANLPADFNDEPMDGMQYLFMVRRDAKKLPGTVRVANPYETVEGHLPLEAPTIRVPVKNSCLPSQKWREIFQIRFQNFRTNLNQPTIHVGPISIGQHRLMPEKKDRDMWWAFLSGKPESEWNPSKKARSKAKKKPPARGMRAWDDPFREESEIAGPSNSSVGNDEGEVEEVLRVNPAETLPSPIGTPVPLEHLEEMSQPSLIMGPCLPEEILRPREPTTELLRKINERVALHLLMYFTYWINIYLKTPEPNDYLPTESHARWIFCLLSRIDDYISADDMNLLRNLARSCLALLKQIKQKENPSLSTPSSSPSRKIRESSCWIVIALVADNWKQRDLWMDAEDSLKYLQIS